MIGTIVNTATIIVGTIIGTILHRGIKEKYKLMLYNALGLASLAIRGQQRLFIHLLINFLQNSPTAQIITRTLSSVFIGIVLFVLYIADYHL